jgi:hypothetical protein
VASEAVEQGRDMGLPEDAIRAVLVEAAPDSATWSGGWSTIVDSLLSEAAEQPATASGGEARGAAEVAALSDAEVMEEYAEVLRTDEAAGDSPPEGGSDDEAQAYREALEEQALTIVARDTIAALGGRVGSLELRASRQEAELDEAEEELEAVENRSMLRRLLDLAEDLGFGFGWAALYMTVVLSWWKGQTVGKRMLGIRVVRLDGEPITWWVAFERVGGYAAGVATGLLGFAQIWWDSNRQAIHDRIVGTVVVRDGAEKVLDWESAL